MGTPPQMVVDNERIDRIRIHTILICPHLGDFSCLGILQVREILINQETDFLDDDRVRLENATALKGSSMPKPCPFCGRRPTPTTHRVSLPFLAERAI